MKIGEQTDECGWLGIFPALAPVELQRFRNAPSSLSHV